MALVKYKIIKKGISKELSEFCFNYFNLKKQVTDHLFLNNFLPKDTSLFGTYQDEQVPNTYSHYADLVMETLLLKCQEVIEKEINTKLQPSYSLCTYL